MLGAAIVAVVATAGVALATRTDHSSAVDAAATAALQQRAADELSRDLERATTPTHGPHAVRGAATQQATPSPGVTTAPPKSTYVVPTKAACATYSGNKQIACDLLDSYGFGLEQMSPLIKLWNRESGWSVTAYNASSGAYGIPQALPGSKMASVADDWKTNPATQIRWGLGYIKGRYGTPAAAWAHSQATGWY